MAATLRDFLFELEAAGELHRIRRPVSPRLEIAEIADRHAKVLAPTPSANAVAFDPGHAGGGGRALLFESVEGCDLPLAINVFGSYRRTEMALGVAGTGGFGAVASRLASLTKPEPPRSLGAMIGKGRELLPLLRTPPRRVRQGVCQEVVRRTERGEVDLRRLPLIQCWPLDGDPTAVGYPMSAEAAGTAGGEGRYVTFAGMHTIHARDARENKPASHNIGMYRAQLVGPTQLVMHWHVHHDGAAHWRSWQAAKMPMPIAICFGGESVLPYAATAPLPPGISELLMAGFLNGRGIPLVRAKTVPLWVPANSEVVIEGFVRTDAGPIGFDPRRDPDGLGPGAAFEGPFGDHTGYYSLPDRYPLVDVTAVTHRRDAIFPATIVGRPPQEDYYLGKATERIFLPLLKTLIPDIEDYHLPMFGCFHNCAFIAIDKAYPLQARRVMHAVWGAGQMAWTKMIVVVDGDVNVHDEAAVLRAMFTHCHFGRDVEIVNGPLDILDHAAPRLGAGHKIGFDATRRMTGEEVGGYDLTPPPPADREAVTRRLEPLAGHDAIDRITVPAVGGGRVVFASVRKTAAGQGAAAIDRIFAATDTGADFVVAVDEDADVGDWSDTFFHLCANADPGRDLHRRGARLGIDATRKLPGDERNGQPVRDYPPIIQMTETVRERVEMHRGEFGL
ncbi:MAG: UbiD family decarboxylase [Phycisphaerales bacterium]|nr:UbiD family decarboxylase [Phycisphaerae bacterium]NNM25406.1 UbiD family decarboxylase [Phycisphaerales bacterium]